MKRVHLGDKGNTSIFSKKVNKSDISLEAIGNLDELVSLIGMCRYLKGYDEVENILKKVQEDLFSIGSEIGSNVAETKSFTPVTKDMVGFLDKCIQDFEGQLPELKRFILPGGTRQASLLHVARSVCRRAERSIVKLSKEACLNESIVPYVNRLSDLLFATARYVNFKSGVKEVEWIGSKKGS